MQGLSKTLNVHWGISAFLAAAWLSLLVVPVQLSGLKPSVYTSSPSAFSSLPSADRGWNYDPFKLAASALSGSAANKINQSEKFLSLCSAALIFEVLIGSAVRAHDAQVFDLFSFIPPNKASP